MTAQTEPYSVQLDGLFEGPMDLLVHLIKKNEVDIYDIPIALITDQYLAAIELLQALNVELAGDFLVMAATLTQIKSRLLLPVHDEEDDAEDPRSEITRPLLEYLEMKAAAEALSGRHLLGENTFVRSKLKPAELPVFDEDEVVHVGLFELIDAFQRILERMAPDHRVDMTTERVTVKDRINGLIDLLEERGSITFEELFQGEFTRSDVIVTFLAVLEMVKLQLIRVAQHIQSGIIRLFYQ
ncbi:MAG: segregation/condensation protein A [Pseudomonadota bacterium]